MKKKFINNIIEWFGDDISIQSTNNHYLVSMNVNESALIYWAFQYGEHVKIISPKGTIKKFKEILKKIYNKYFNYL